MMSEQKEIYDNIDFSSFVEANTQGVYQRMESRSQLVYQSRVMSLWSMVLQMFGLRKKIC